MMYPFNPEKVLTLMYVIEENAPLSLEYADDGRYTWPKRWSQLKEEIEKQQTMEKLDDI